MSGQISYTALLKQSPRFRNLFYSQSISTLGDWFNTIALLSIVYDVSQSSLMVSFTLIAKALPSLLIGPFAGVFIDRYDRKKIMMYSHLINAILVLGLIAAPKYIWIVFVVNALTSIVTTFFSPARQSVIPQVVHKDHLYLANTLSSTTWGIMSIVGASLGGVVSQFLGTNVIFMLDSATFLIAFWLIWITPLPAIQSTTGKQLQFFQEMRDGFSFVLKNPIIFTLIAVGASWGIVGGAYQVLLTFFGMDVFDDGKTGVGLLYAVQGIGVIVGGLLVKKVVSGNDQRMKSFFGWSYLGQGVFFVLFALSPNLWVGLLLLLLMRIAGGIIIPLDTTLIQKYTPQDMIGKVFTLHGAVYTSIMQLSMFLTGVFLKSMSPREIGVFMGGITCLVSVVWLVMFYRNKLSGDRLAIPGTQKKSEQVSS